MHSLDIKTVLFQTIQFSISTQFSSIWTIDKTIRCSHSEPDVYLESMAVKEYPVFREARTLLESDHEIG